MAIFLRDKTFKQQLNVAVVFAVLSFALLSSLLISWQGSRQIRSTLVEQGARIAENLANQSALALVYASADNANDAVNSTLAFPDVKRVEIHYHDGKLLLMRGTLPAAVGDVSVPEGELTSAYLEAETDDAWRFVAPVRTKAAASPFEMSERGQEMLGFVRVVQSKETLARMLAQIFVANLAISLLFAWAFLLVVRRLAARMTQPITALSEAMARAERGEADVHAPVDGPKDIRDMAQAFNSMMRALQERERALRESQANYREVVESVKEIIFQTDADDRWVLLNPAWQEITGIPVDAALGRPMVELFHAEDRSMMQDWQDRLRRGEVQACRFEVRFTRSDGSNGWLEVAQHVRNEEGAAYAGTAGTLFDITERWLAADRLESLNAELEDRVRLRTSQLEASNRELEAFSYSVSHDLRAPLRAIEGFARIIEEDYAEKLDDTGRQYFQRVRDASRRMASLIDDLLELARITRTELRYEKLDLAHLARDVVRGLAEAEPQRRYQAEIAAEATAYGDPVLIRVVLDNLLSNAWKYTGLRDMAHIEFGVGERTTERGTETVFYVRDNGAGFDMQYADKLFRPFNRLHPNSQFAGTGIGLATVQRIVHRHGGEIWADSQVDVGSSFYFTLPERCD
ncbi:MAG: sensor histidine kinase [Ignavibacteria bacterium]